MEEGQSIYDYAYHKVETGADFKIDLKSRIVTVDGEVLIENGKYEGTLGVPVLSEQKFVLNELQALYSLYKFSTPTERSERKKHTYFYALPADELSKVHSVYFGNRRDVAQFNLEFMFIGFILTGQLKWQPEWKGYYWRPSKESTLRIQREWIE